MLLQRCFSWLSILLIIALGMSAAFAQNYPNKPIRIITASPGGGADLVARLIAQGISGRLGQQIIIDNRGGVIAADTVAKAAADGYTLLFHGSTVWLLPFLQDHVSYDPIKDFAPVTVAVSQPNILVVHPSLPVKSLLELIALAKARPGELNYASAGTGGTPHLAGELFKAMAGINIVRVNYKGIGAALTAQMGGEVQVMFPVAPSVLPHIKSGRLRALAITSKEPSALAPGLSTMTASGLPGYESLSLLGMFAPAGTPPELVTLLNQEIVRGLHTTDIKERIFNSGAEVVGSSPEQFASTLKSEMAKWGKLIKESGIRE